MSEQIEQIQTVKSELFLQLNQSIVKPNYPIINLPFPPIIKPKDLIINKKSPQDNPNGKQIRAPNAFIIYRKAFVKAARDQGYVLPMTVISSMASASWDQEIGEVKEEYKRIAKDTHKLVKEMFPKKSNQRKRKEKWNLVSFQNNSLNGNNNVIKANLPEDSNSSGEGFENVIISAEESTTINDNNDNNMFNTQNLSLLTPLTLLTPILTSSSPNLSEFDNISEKSSPFQQHNYQISNNYLIDELSPSLPNSFQDYLSSCLPEEDNQTGNNLLLTNWLNQSENYSEFTLEGFLDIPTPIDDLKCIINNNSQSSLNMTLAEAENFDFLENIDFIHL